MSKTITGAPSPPWPPLSPLLPWPLAPICQPVRRQGHRRQRQGPTAYGIHSCKGQSDCKTAEHARGPERLQGPWLQGHEGGRVPNANGTISDIK